MRSTWQGLVLVWAVLAGQLACAQLVVSPAPSLDMGAAAPGQILESRLTVQNTGAVRAFPDVHLWGGLFWLHRSTCILPMGLAPGQSCQLLVRFSAASACSNYHADLLLEDWSNLQNSVSMHLTASGGLGTPECDQGQYPSNNRWNRVIGPYPGTREYAGSYLTVADLGHDGELDTIVVVVPQTVDPADWYVEKLSQVYVYTYTSGGQFVETTTRWFGSSPVMMPNLYMAVVADLNGDGKDDVAFACNDEDGRPYFDAGNVTRLWYTHQYAFVSGTGDAYTVKTLGSNVEYGTGLDAADVDRDGDVDLLMSGEMPVPGMPGEMGMYVLVNDGQANFSVGQVIPWNTPDASSRHIAWPRFADLDNDGDRDLLVGRIRNGSVAVMRNDAGLFVYQRDIMMFPGSYQAGDDSFHLNLGFASASVEGVNDVKVADMDGDGLLDFVAFATGQLDQQSFLAQYTVVRVARGVGGMDFQPMGNPFDLGQLGGALLMQVLPVDRDGAVDVFLRSQAGWEGRLQHKQLRNLGDGRLRYENMLAFPSTDPFYDAVHLADMNRDGRPDLLYALNGSGQPGERGVLVNAMPAAMNRPLQVLSVDDVSLTEGNVGTQQANFRVSLSQPAPVPVSFDAYTAPGTASPGVDYQSNAVISQTIATGDTGGNFAVTINGDTTVENHESFTVNLANALDAGIADGQGQGRIANDDLAQLSIADASLAEGNSGTSTLSFVIQLSRAMPNPVTFDIATGDGTASAGSDYVARGQVGRFLDAGRTRQLFEVAINGDATTELDETFIVTISNASGAVLADGSAVGTIVNDDTAAKRGSKAQLLRQKRVVPPERSIGRH